jgi:hypothetical protein
MNMSSSGFDILSAADAACRVAREQGYKDGVKDVAKAVKQARNEVYAELEAEIEAILDLDQKRNKYAIGDFLIKKIRKELYG